MLFLHIGEITVVKMAEHYVDSAYRTEIPVAAAVDDGNGLNCIRIPPDIPVAHYSAVMVAEILSVGVVLSSAEIGIDPAVGEKGVTLVHIGPEVFIIEEGVAFHQYPGWDVL